MAHLNGDWIWALDRQPTENRVACFAQTFVADKRMQPVILRICAVTRYTAYVNGVEIGNGPIRAMPGKFCHDRHDITAHLKSGSNLLAVRVWDYGCSTYQTISSPAGLIFDVMRGQELLAASSVQTKACRDLGMKYNVPKRNVNLGFMESYNAALFSQDWMANIDNSTAWECAVTAVGYGNELPERPFPNYTSSWRRPQRVVSLCETVAGSQQVTLNTRETFFPGRRDANETIFSAFIGVVIESPTQQDGLISFPNRTWNGIMGDFCISGKRYPVSNASRAIRVSLAKGRQLFLLQVSGKFDDLFCHIEFKFDQLISFSSPSNSSPDPFFAVTPTGMITQQLDGVSQVYGGLDELNRMPSHTELHDQVFACATELEILRHSDKMRYIPDTYTMYDEYLYSLASTETVVREVPVTGSICGILWSNSTPTLLTVPEQGSFNRLIVDFGDIYVGTFELTLRASEGTTIDIYCFENMYGNDIDFTVGLNNGIRYICAGGYQTYRCLSRMGCRFAMITTRGQTEATEIYSLEIRHATYPASNRGSFRCNDTLLNRIWEMSRHTHTLCMEDTFTDCPTYEQSYWIGDAQISSNVNVFLHGEYALIRHCLTLATTAAHNTPLHNALTPTDWDTSIPMWTMNWILAIEQYVYFSGDEGLIPELYPHIKAVLAAYALLIHEDGGFLINAWNMLDWAAMDIHNHCIVTGQQGVLAYCYRICAGFAEKLGYAADCAEWSRIDKRLLDYIDTSLWDAEQKMYVDGWSPEHGVSKTASIQTHALLLYFDAIADPRKRLLVESYINDQPESFVKAGSPFILFYIYQLWGKGQNFDRVIGDIKQRWGMMLRYDSTTCWEVFPGFYEVSRTRSYCQSWSSIPIYFANKYLLGANIAAQAFDVVELSVPNTELTWCEGTIPTPHGDISIWWSRENNKKTYRIRAPHAIDIVCAQGFDWELTIHRI